VLELGGTRRPLTFTFALVNDSDSDLNPEIDRAQLVINDHEWPDSAMMFSNGPRDIRFERLPAGDTLIFAYALDSVFKEPGVYRVAWRGPGYESAPVTIRVLAPRLSAP
jgi:hypothetical protein